MPLEAYPMTFDRSLVYKLGEFCRQLINGGAHDGFVCSNEPELPDVRAIVDVKQQPPFLEPWLTDLHPKVFGHSPQTIWSRLPLDDPLTLQVFARSRPCERVAGRRRSWRRVPRSDEIQKVRHPAISLIDSRYAR